MRSLQHPILPARALRRARAWLVVAVLVALPGCDRLPFRQAPVRLHYAIAVSGDAGQGATVEVTASGPVPRGFRLLLPPQGPRRQLIALDDQGRARYQVAAPKPPHGGAGFACYRGFEILAQPAGVQPGRSDSVAISFDLPATVRVVAPLAGLAADPDAPARGALVLPRDEFDLLLTSYLALGDYTVRVLPGGPELPAIVWGRRGLGAATEGELLDLVTRLLEAHVAQFGPDRPEHPLSVVVDYPYTGHGFAGNATGRSIDLRLSRDLGPDESPGLVRLLAHEIAHFWLGGAFQFPRAEDHWFVEGAADYYGMRARVAAGLTDEAAAGDELAEQWYELQGNRWLREPMEDLGREYLHDPQAFTAAYARGCLTTWALDWRAALLDRPPLAQSLRESALGRDHSSMKTILTMHLRGPGWKPGALGEDPGAEVAGLLSDDPVNTFLGTLAAAGLSYRAVATDQLTFGLERFEPGTTRLMAVPAGSPAEDAGIQPGDAIREIDGVPVHDTVGLQRAIERSYGRPAYKLEGMELTIERAGTFDRMRLFAAPDLRPEWVDAAGRRATAVLPAHLTAATAQ